MNTSAAICYDACSRIDPTPQNEQTVDRGRPRLWKRGRQANGGLYFCDVGGSAQCARDGQARGC